MFEWATFRTAKDDLKIHTCWNSNLPIPDLVNITEAKTHHRCCIGFKLKIFLLLGLRQIQCKNPSKHWIFLIQKL